MPQPIANHNRSRLIIPDSPEEKQLQQEYLNTIRTGRYDEDRNRINQIKSALSGSRDKMTIDPQPQVLAFEAVDENKKLKEELNEVKQKEDQLTHRLDSLQNEHREQKNTYESVLQQMQQEIQNLSQQVQDQRQSQAQIRTMDTSHSHSNIPMSGRKNEATNESASSLKQRPNATQ